LINATTRHPILESLLYYRAQQALAEADYGRAERDANDLLAQFPASPLRAHAYGVLTQSAWEQRRFRSVADNARKARAELPATETRARFYLGEIDAEASYRAGTSAGLGGQADFRSAADAYANILREPPADLNSRDRGRLILQRVLAEIKSDSGDAPKLIDELKKDPAFDLENRWQAEWQLAQSLMLKGKIVAAYDRVSGLLAEAPAGAGSELQPELRARMAWLQIRLAFESKQFAQSQTHADALLGAPPEIAPELKGQILSDVILLKGQAELALGREPIALETLKRLRTEYPKSAAAVRSYMIEAAHNEGQGKIVDAMRGLTALVNNPDYRSSDLVPEALFQLALLSERLGRKENLEDANKRIEELVNNPAATGQTGLIFAARLKQGDIFRTLNDFPAARRAYEDLVNRYPRHPDVTVAMLRLAITEAAQATIDPSFAPKAAQKFEDLRERLDAPIDVRVQAGYMYGMLLRDSGDDAKAVAAWWLDVITPFLLKNNKTIEQGPRSAWWLARTLNELAELQEKHGRLEDMKAAYELLLKSNLGSGEGTARAKLQQYGVPTAAL
jgi:TolA-binding protein